MVAGVVDQGGGLEDGEVGCGLAADRLAGELGADAVVGGGEPFDAVGLGPFPAEQPRLGRFFKQPLYMRLFVPSIFHKIQCRFSAESRRPPTGGCSMKNAAILQWKRDATQTPQGLTFSS